MKSMLRQVREARANAREARAMPKALGGAIGANKARDRLGTKNSNGDFYEDDTDSMTNKLKDKQLNVLGIMRKLGGKQDENCTLEELLFDLGMSEDQFLIFGEIWRKYGRRDEAASLRQRDQFIFLKDLPALVRDVGKKCFVSASTASSVLSQKSNTVVSQIEE
ncbi:Oidioi.mRNA.OKI2018_I69.XSR.g16270.t2.cds [Oikopleura dioica]|uniref:Oidioi.mRNA.OKI2018_I69.XSR.g16270.t2.cds n=1 Tax=Oikopleura dioica TaxID=34765 RepID=A0ABN7SG23_OIKDI|nr:Oidioi.mRNA.OKI2018_I69.XSR.g16270.t2.cds [Oikopleura dioica]